MGPAYPFLWYGMNASAGKMYSFSVHVISISLLLFTDLSNSSLTKYLNCLHSKPAPPGNMYLVYALPMDFLACGTETIHLYDLLKNK